MESNDIALALSGGGVRALAFHSGVLRYIAEQGQLEHVKFISTVSGASLLIGLVFHRSGMAWPSSRAYLSSTAPAIRHLITTQDLQACATARLLFWPLNWRFAFSRANVFAQTIQALWKINETLADLPYSPEWSINGTTAETGKRFRFKNGQLGDYELGYATAPDFPQASAMAMSAAFPVGIGPLAINVRQYRWMKRPYWGAPAKEAQSISAPYSKLHIYDGGVYDNLGLEPFFDLGRNQPKGAYRIVASDAGAPLTRGFDFWGLNPFRMKRLMDVITEQTRALRVRTFVEFLRKGNRGAYLGIGAVPARLFAGCPRPPDGMNTWLSDAEITAACTFPTHLHVLAPEVFDRIERHGYETALATQLAYPYLSVGQREVAPLSSA
jgi:NTE family protein